MPAQVKKLPRKRVSGSRPNTPPRRPPRFSRELAILYEDDAVIAVNKPAGLLAVPIPGSDAPSALSLLVQDLKSRRQSALIVHRIDRFASGVLLFAKTARDRNALIKQFLAHTPVRQYIAVSAATSPRKRKLWSTIFEKKVCIKSSAPSAIAKPRVQNSAIPSNALYAGPRCCESL